MILYDGHYKQWRWVKRHKLGYRPAVIDKMEELADDGDEQYASGDGLQVTEFIFPDDFDLDAWLKVNHTAAEVAGHNVIRNNQGCYPQINI
jgi:hypothetical protein